MRVDVRALFGLALFAGLILHGPAWAQTDTGGIVDRLDRLERDLNVLQSQFYRNQGASGQPSASANGNGSAAISGTAYGQLDDRISALESQLQQLTGQLEKANFSLSQLSGKVERMQADNDFRFKELEAKAGISPATAPAQPPGQTGQSTGAGPTSLVPNAPAAGALSTEGNQGMGSPPGFLAHPATHGTSGAQPMGGPAQPGPAAVSAGAGAAGALVGKTPQEQYDHAFGLLRNSEYDGATKAFQAFIAQHPQDPLAGNATYWLAQIPYSQGQYEQAAVIFLDAYRKYPKSAKAGESLLKVGMSMSQLGKKKEACAALHRFGMEFPEAADTLKRQANSEKQKLGC